MTTRSRAALFPDIPTIDEAGVRGLTEHFTRARREGMEIEGITLWVFGGVAQFRGSFPSAGAELRIERQTDVAAAEPSAAAGSSSPVENESAK